MHPAPVLRATVSSSCPEPRRPRELNIVCCMFWPRQSLGLGDSYRHLGPAAARTKVTRKSRKMWGSGQLAAEVFCPSCSDRPGRACVKGVRELELFLLTLRPQVSSGQPPPLPEPLPSSPGEDRRLQQALPTLLHLKTQSLGLPPAVPTCSVIARWTSWLVFSCATGTWDPSSIHEDERL